MTAMNPKLRNVTDSAFKPPPSHTPIRWGDREAALARERQASLVACALMGVQEAAGWVGDPVLTRHVGDAVGRVLALLRQIRKFTEAP